MTPKRKIFGNPFRCISRGHRFTCRGQIWWKSAVGKPTKYHICSLLRRKNPAPPDTSEPPFCPTELFAPRISWMLCKRLIFLTPKVI